MLQGQLYKHIKGGIYRFECIALPIRDEHGRNRIPFTEFRHYQQFDVALDAHTPKGETPRRIKLYMSGECCYIDREYPHVIYQAEKDFNTIIVWARRIDDFFGMAQQPVTLQYMNRFTRIE